jgi:hypothetical protein
MSDTRELVLKTEMAESCIPLRPTEMIAGPRQRPARIREHRATDGRVPSPAARARRQVSRQRRSVRRRAAHGVERADDGSCDQCSDQSDRGEHRLQGCVLRNAELAHGTAEQR